MKNLQIVGIFVAVLMVIVSGCIEEEDDDGEGDVIPDDTLYLNSGANGMTSSEVDLTDLMDSNHMKIVITLDKEGSANEHVIYLYLFEGAPPPTSSVGLDGIQAALAGGALELFTMTWENDEITWEVDFNPSSLGYFTLTLWNPDRDEYDNSTPDAYVDVEIFFSKSGGVGNNDEPYEFTFREYDITDWSENNEDATPLSALEMCDLVTSHMGDISPGGRITAFTSGGFTGTGLDKDTGKCPGWQVYVLRSEDGEFVSKTINIAENGWAIVYDDHTVMEYPEWDPDPALVDSTDLPAKALANETAGVWLAEHPNAKLTIQSYHGPPIDSEEGSYILKYEAGEDALDVFISAVDGRVIEVDDSA